jgi:cobalt/nickel transport protein
MKIAAFKPAAMVLMLICVSAAHAHYNMLLPDKASVKRGDEVNIVYQWGHPFEHQIFDAPAPRELWLVTPEGNKVSVLHQLQKRTNPAPVTFRLRLRAQERGDYVFGLVSAPIWMEQEQEFVEDYVKAVLHVQAQRSWDAKLGMDFELVPLTRPYGLRPGCVYQAQALEAGKPLTNALVEVEHYNAQPPKTLPPDEQITRTVKTDPNGVATCTLAKPGWWCITAQKLDGTHDHAGKPCPVRKRATLWIYVDEAEP